MERITIEGRELVMDDPIIHAEMMASMDYYEAPMLRWIDKNIRPGLVIDVGANFGNHSVFLARKGWQVIAIEPVKENMQLLQENTKGLDVIPIWAGASNRPDMARVVKEEGWRWSQAQLIAHDGSDAESVHVIPLDIFAVNNVSLIKIDAEGMELPILEGASNILRLRKPELFIEGHDEEDRLALIDALEPYGYKLIERYGHAATYHFSASGKFKVTYTHPK